MGFLDRFWKKTVGLEDAGKYLLSVAMSGLESFLNEDLPKIAEYCDLDFDKYNIDILRSKVMTLGLWAATKALEGDDYHLIHSIHDAFFSVFEDKKANQLREAFSFFSEKFNEAWDDNSGGNQSILSVNILSEIFYDGEMNRNILDALAMARAQFFVFSTMENVLNARNRIRLKF